MPFTLTSNGQANIIKDGWNETKKAASDTKNEVKKAASDTKNEAKKAASDTAQEAKDATAKKAQAAKDEAAKKAKATKDAAAAEAKAAKDAAAKKANSTADTAGKKASDTADAAGKKASDTVADTKASFDCTTSCKSTKCGKKGAEELIEKCTACNEAGKFKGTMSSKCLKDDASPSTTPSGSAATGDSDKSDWTCTTAYCSSTKCKKADNRNWCKANCVGKGDFAKRDMSKKCTG